MSPAPASLAKAKHTQVTMVFQFSEVYYEAALLNQFTTSCLQQAVGIEDPMYDVDKRVSFLPDEENQDSPQLTPPNILSAYVANRASACLAKNWGTEHPLISGPAINYSPDGHFVLTFDAKKHHRQIAL